VIGELVTVEFPVAGVVVNTGTVFAFPLPVTVCAAALIANAKIPKVIAVIFLCIGPHALSLVADCISSSSPYCPVARHEFLRFRRSVHLWLVAESLGQDRHRIAWRGAQQNLTEWPVALCIPSHPKDSPGLRFQDFGGNGRPETWILVEQAHKLKFSVMHGLDFHEKNILVGSPRSANLGTGREKPYLRFLNSYVRSRVCRSDGYRYARHDGQSSDKFCGSQRSLPKMLSA
jgi:hypothetical protein